ncbi:LysR family transcriptional regulator [Rossellomorea aquimaris]|uniref:DNA-binding transcriptional LysR family regulator n=1 Tax=Rossellomorea aquimaris TaxID=189382 RepID=A0A366ELB3_9BACI|nr:LysR family transcriptional regulator [Rossellomorea aquimaris]RBP02510.1 DNA-binding transcriptional LysR family regulator [Rossellomorea aquimaris]
MNIEQLEHVTEAAKAGSLTKAADHLHVSLSAISQSISKLEKELGIQLFIRKRQGTALTAEGMKIIEKAEKVLAAIGDLREEANRRSDTLAGNLKIGMIPGPINLLIDMVSAYKTDYPNVKVEIHEIGPVKIVEGIQSNDLDIGLILTSHTFAVQNHELIAEKLLVGRMVAGVSKQSPLALLDRISPEQLMKETLVLYNDDYIKRFAHDTLSPYGPIDTLFTTNNTEAIKRAVESGVAVTLGMDYSFRSRSPYQNHTVIPINIVGNEKEPLNLEMIRRKDKVPSRKVKEFIKRIHRELK